MSDIFVAAYFITGMIVSGYALAKVNEPSAWILLPFAVPFWPVVLGALIYYRGQSKT
jgi:hypothetical protein